MKIVWTIFALIFAVSCSNLDYEDPDTVIGKIDDESSSSQMSSSEGSSSSLVATQSSSAETSSSSSSIAVPSSSSIAVSSSSSVKASSSSVNVSSSSSQVPSSSSSQVQPSSSSQVISSSSSTDSGVLEDIRDGKSYTYAKIGNQVWMTQNLNFGTRVNGSSDQADELKVEKYCYNDAENNCDSYGALYQWHEALFMGKDCATNSCAASVQINHQGICPDDWHIPTNEEFMALDKVLKENPTLASQFKSQLAGYRDHNLGTFGQLQTTLRIWVVDELVNLVSAKNGFFDQTTSAEDSNTKLKGLSVRCVRN